jgi:tetratricopeptide (TPR) repeat protein
MLRATIVVFLLLFARCLLATELNHSIASLESAWAEVYYQKDEALQKQVYPVLLQRSAELVKRYPGAAEPKVWLATIMATNAAFESSLDALSSLVKAKALLEEAIKINPQALDGAAYVTLGTLYYMLPGWPVSFGDEKMAEQLLKTSLSINPNGIDANYYYADFLLGRDRVAEAIVFFQRASQAPLRQQQLFADTELQNEARLGLVNARHRKSGADKNRFHSLFAAMAVKSD